MENTSGLESHLYNLASYQICSAQPAQFVHSVHVPEPKCCETKSLPNLTDQQYTNCVMDFPVIWNRNWCKNINSACQGMSLLYTTNAFSEIMQRLRK